MDSRAIEEHKITTLSLGTTLELTRYAKVIALNVGLGCFRIFEEHLTGQDYTETWKFTVFPDGPIPDEAGTYQATTFVNGKAWHLYGRRI